jgi:hypothetical protein
MTKGVLTFCINTEFYRYDKIARKTLPLLCHNLGLPVTVITNQQTRDLLPEMHGVNYVLIENQTGNMINNKPWHNLDRHRAYELSPYDKTLLVDVDYFCFTDNMLSLFDTREDFLVHDQVYDITGKNSYNFRANSSIPMVWATLIFFRKGARSKSVFDMVGYIKKNYDYFCNLYRIDFKNFRNDYAFAIALQQLYGFKQFPVIPTKLPTLPAVAKVQSVDEDGISWQVDGRKSSINNIDVHVIDKGVADV